MSCLLRHSLVANTQSTTANCQNYETSPALVDHEGDLTNCCQHLKNRYLQRGGISADTLCYALLGPLPGRAEGPFIATRNSSNTNGFSNISTPVYLEPICRQHAPGQSSQVTQPYFGPRPWPPRQNCRVRETRDIAACFLSAAPSLPTTAGGRTPPR
jgi:hypothetical protein